MSELGEVLRRTRLEKGITLDEMSEATKIQKKYLQAIEDGNLDQLPGSFYARAFIKNYAEYVGLDSNELLHQYMSSTPRTEIDSYSTLKRTRPAVKREIRWDGWLSRLLLFSFIGLICVVIYVFVVQKDAGDENNTVSPNELNNNIGVKGEDPKQTESEPPKEEEPKPTPEEKPPATPQLTLASQNNNVYNYEVTNVDQISLELVTKDRFWYEAFKLNTDGTQGEKISEKLLDKGTTLALSDPNGVYIRSAAFLYADLKVNGITLDTSKLSTNTKLYFKKKTETQ